VIVIDASLYVPLILDDEERAYSRRVIDDIKRNRPLVFIPSHFFIEVYNAAFQAYRRKRISRELLLAHLQLLHEFPAIVEPVLEPLSCVAWAEKHALTMYDAAYLSLTASKSAKLATLDKQLIKAATQEQLYYA